LELITQQITVLHTDHITEDLFGEWVCWEEGGVLKLVFTISLGDCVQEAWINPGILNADCQINCWHLFFEDC